MHTVIIGIALVPNMKQLKAKRRVVEFRIDNIVNWGRQESHPIPAYPRNPSL